MKRISFDFERVRIESTEIDALFLKTFPEEAQWSHLAERKNLLSFDNSAPWVEPVRFIPMMPKSEADSLQELADKAAGKIITIASGAAWSSAKAGVDFFNIGSDVIFTDRTHDTSTLPILNDEDFCLCVIEDGALSNASQKEYEEIKKLLQGKYGSDSRKRIFIFTNNSKSPLAKEDASVCLANPSLTGNALALSQGPLFLLAAKGINIKEILESAELPPLPDTSLFVPNCCGDGCLGKDLVMPFSYTNIKYYSIVRSLMAAKGKTTEAFLWIDKRFEGISFWLKNLFMDSGDKLFPNTLSLDHIDSLMSSVKRNNTSLFETFLDFGDYDESPFEENESSLGFMIKSAMHRQYMSGVPMIRIVVPAADPSSYGDFISMFQRTAKLADIWEGDNAA